MSHGVPQLTPLHVCNQGVGLLGLRKARRSCNFLEDLVKSLQTDEDLKKLLTALSKWISAFEDRIWELALSKELAEEEVALRV